LKEQELREELYEYLLPYYRQGLDAVIVQDLGVLKYIKEHFPDLPIHASTQMTVNDVLGAKFLAELGVERVVTSREMHIDEIREIIAEHKRHAEELEHTLMFCKENGTPYTYSDIRRRLETVNKMCNEISLLETEPFEFGKFTLHQLRHTYCTHLYESGIDLFAAQYFMGHDKGKVTMDIYTSLREKHTQTAAAAVRKINFTSISPEVFREGGEVNG